MKARLASWWRRRKPRERLLVLAAALMGIGAIADRVTLAPLRAQTLRVQAELTSARAELDQLHGAIESGANSAGAAGQARKNALDARRQAVEATLRAAEADLISPEQMPRQLAAMLDKFPQMNVVAMNTLPPVLVGAGGATATNAAPGKPAIGLYQHGLQITVEGRYLDLIGYLQALEHAPYRVYWRALSLNVEPTRGIPVTKIELFTLSQDPAWLAL